LCFNWVCKAIYPSASSIWSPSRGSHSFEWITFIWVNQTRLIYRYLFCLTVVCLPAQARVIYALASCKIISNSTDKCHTFNCWPLPLGKQSLWMKCICSGMAQTNSLRLQKNNPTDNFEFKYKSICLLLLMLFPSFHYKCSVLGFRTLGCPSLCVTTKRRLQWNLGVQGCSVVPHKCSDKQGQGDEVKIGNRSCRAILQHIVQFYRSRFEEYSSCSRMGSNNHGYWTSHCQRRRPFRKLRKPGQLTTTRRTPVRRQSRGRHGETHQERATKLLGPDSKAIYMYILGSANSTSGSRQPQQPTHRTKRT